jgi:hypothetical protein
MPAPAHEQLMYSRGNKLRLRSRRENIHSRGSEGELTGDRGSPIGAEGRPRTFCGFFLPGSPATGLRRWGGRRSHFARLWRLHGNRRTARTAPPRRFPRRSQFCSTRIGFPSGSSLEETTAKRPTGASTSGRWTGKNRYLQQKLHKCYFCGIRSNRFGVLFPCIVFFVP